jgi:uncharacterized membrane-anchored protein
MTVHTRWALRFWAICIVVALAGIAALWIVFGFSSMDLTANALFALSLGVVFSVVIGAGLMALIFYSSRSGRDESARGEDRR